MAKQYEIKKIEFNAKMSGKYDGAYLETIGVDSGSKRKDFVFKNNVAQYGTLKECEVGNIIELKLVKNGEFFNLAKDDDAIKIISQYPSAKTAATPSVDKKEWVNPKNDPSIQSAIIRQNALTNAVNLVTSMLDKGLYPAKVTSDLLIVDTVRIATEFAKFSSGESITVGEEKAKKKKGEPEEDPEKSTFGE